jgi:polysaccharide export outer membrane protein
MSNTLVDPTLDVVVGTFAPKRVFVGGEVNAPGILELPGQIDPLQAIIMAGGFTERARETQVILIRRLPGGEVISFDFDIKAGWTNPKLASFGPMERFDVIYVPKSRIAVQNQFIQQYIRNALPIDFSFYYDIAGNSQR